MDIVRIIYFSYVHSVMSYGIILGGNSHDSNSIFKIPKRMIRIITNTGSRVSCRQLFSYKHFHFHLNTFSHYFFLSTRIALYFNLILKFMISIHVSTTTYIYLLQNLISVQTAVLSNDTKLLRSTSNS